MRKTPLVLGGLSIGLGCLTSLTSLTGLFVQPMMKGWLSSMGHFMDKMPRRAGQPSPVDMMEKGAAAVETLRPYQTALSGTLLAFSIVLVAIGLGLYRRQIWSRTAALAWAIAALAWVPVMVYLQAFIIQPQTQQAMMTSFQGPGTPPGLNNFMGSMLQFQVIATVISTVAFYAPFPIVLLATLCKKKAREDFVPGAAAP
jgi:hypothetical protein